MTEQTTTDVKDEKISLHQLQRNRDQAYKWQERRHAQWTESYELDRDLVITNRLVQRQSVNIPLMKETLKTRASKVKMVDLVFEEKKTERVNGIPDKQKELMKNELWRETVKQQKLKTKNRANVKQEMLYGRSFWKLGIAHGKFWAEVEDPYDILIDRYADPADIDGTAMFIIHQHIFKPLKEVAANPDYDSEMIKELETFYATTAGIIKSSENAESLSDRDQRMSDMGVPDVSNPLVGETIVELEEHYVKHWDDDKKDWVIYLVTMCGTRKLQETPLEDVLGINFFPFVSWADDMERTDIWSDGIADIIRTINKVLNAFFSQLIENRTLRNFGMNYYDATANESWQPDTQEPAPGAWFPLPGKPSDVFQRVDIPDLSESLDEMEFLIQLAQRASAATALNQGQSERSQITLGEVQLLLSQTEDRQSDLTDAHQDMWLEFGDKWSKIMNANADRLDPVTLTKKSYAGNYFQKTVKPSDWKSESGYVCIVKSAVEDQKDKFDLLQKALAVRQQFPANLPLKKITDNMLLDVLPLTDEETKQVLDFEDKLAAQPAAPALPSEPGAPGQKQLTPQPNAAVPVAA